MQWTTGGLIHKRHDRVNIVSKMSDSVAYDAQIEPALQPLTGEVLPRSATSDDKGKLDISAQGFWQTDDKAFFDFRIFNPCAKKKNYLMGPYNTGPNNTGLNNTSFKL